MILSGIDLGLFVVKEVYAGTSIVLLEGLAASSQDYSDDVAAHW
jgi:hypothetical protein